MKTPSFILVLAGLFLTFSSSFRPDLYQVISSHPHEVRALRPYIRTVHQNGRLWVVELNKELPSRLSGLIRPLKGGERSFVYRGRGLRRPLTFLNTIDKENIRKDVEDLSSLETRYAGTAGNKKAVLLVKERFIDLGYKVEEICYARGICSVLAEKPGKSRARETIIVMGHLDSVGKSFAGADDNASGTAVLLEMARVLKDYENKKTIRFFVTNGEELGLLGAHHYVKALGERNELKNLALVINMDMVGYNKNGIVELETEPQFEGLAKEFADLAAKNTTLKTKITLGAWGSDHVPFLQKGVPSILTIENWDTKTPCYHQACDKPDTLNYDYAAEIGKLNVSAVLFKDAR